jgi:hypothetical protein
VRRNGSYLGVRFAVHVAAEVTLVELEGFLDAHFLPGQDDLPLWRIEVAGSGPLEAASACAAEVSVWSEPSGAVTITNWTHCIRHHVAPPGASPWLLAQDVYCGIRRLAIATHGACVMLHATCVKAGGRVIALLGEKGSGKTVAMHRLIMRHGASYIAGDKICVWLTPDGGVGCSGLISAVRVKLEDAALLRDAPAHEAVFARARELAADSDRLLGDKVCMAPPEYCRLARAEILPIARPDVLIFLGNGGLDNHRIYDFSPVESAQPETRRVCAVLNSESASRVLDALSRQCASYASGVRPDVAGLMDLISNRVSTVTSISSSE